MKETIMSRSMENEIRELAYLKWERAGYPQCNDEERNRFWYEAEQEIIRKTNDKKKKYP